MKDTIEQPEELTWMNSRFRTILSTEACQGRQALVEIVSDPDSGPPRHIHQAEDEMFYILSGALEFWVEGETMVRTAGQAVFVPRGTDHTFRVVSDQPARYLTVHNPGGFDHFISEVVEKNYQIPADMAEVAETAGRFNCVFTGPPLGPTDAPGEDR